MKIPLNLLVDLRFLPLLSTTRRMRNVTGSGVTRNPTKPPSIHPSTHLPVIYCFICGLVKAINTGRACPFPARGPKGGGFYLLVWRVLVGSAGFICRMIFQ